MRPLGIVAFWLSLVALVGVAALGGSARAGAARQAGTPTAATPQPAGTTNVVTIVAWYSNDPSGEFLNIYPIRVDRGQVAGPEPNAAPIGRADFPDEGLPTVTVGDSAFDSYARFEGDTPERWTWFDDSEGARPATLVLQVQGTGGQYQNYYGTATFISRADLAGGVLILALRPPTPGGAEATATEAPAEAAPAEGAATEGAAEETVGTEEAPTDVMTEEGAGEDGAPTDTGAEAAEPTQ